MLCNDTDPRMVLLSLQPSPFVMPDDALPVSETAFSPNDDDDDPSTVIQKAVPLCLSSLGHSGDSVCAVCPRCSPCCTCGEDDVSEGSSGDNRKVSTEMFRMARTKVTQSRYLGGDFSPELRGQLFRGFAFRQWFVPEQTVCTVKSSECTRFCRNVRTLVYTAPERCAHLPPV